MSGEGSFNEPGKLDNEQLDALKLETSNLSPEKQERMNRVISHCNSTLLDEYGKYIKEPLTNSDVLKRFLMTDRETFSVFYDEWFNRKINTVYLKEGDKGAMRQYVNKEGGFVTGFIPDLWGTLPKDTQDQLIKGKGSPEEAKTFVSEIVSTFFIMHEIAHTYQDPELPLVFLECGAFYYARDIMKKRESGTFSNDQINSQADFYATLIEKYGDDIHKIYFGNYQDKDRKKLIIDEFTPEVQKRIFPDLHTRSEPTSN